MKTSSTRANLKPPESDVPDVLAPGLTAIFCGINPGRVSAAANAHFANPRNDFWRLLHAAGFTPRLYEPSEQFELLKLGLGATNAAYRTTPGSGDLRRADFAGSAERLERIAVELRPGAIGFVGKEAYRGAFGERPELGLQERRLAETALFVLPSTSPANAAVPWSERLRWFQAFRDFAAMRLRQAARAVVLDPADRILLVRFDFPAQSVWAAPGGGLEPGETHEHALARELREEAGLQVVDLGPWIWSRTHVIPFLDGSADGQVERYYLLRTPTFEPAPVFSVEQLASEYVTAIRWWTQRGARRLR